MKRIATSLVVLVAAAAPAFAGDDWDDDYYDSHYWRGDYRIYHSAPAHPYEVYIPYGTYFADEPHVYGPNCKVERKWKRGRYKEKIECDDDDD